MTVHRWASAFGAQASAAPKLLGSDPRLLLAGSAVLGQALGLLGVLALARLYSPNEFGVFAVFSAMVSVLGMFGLMRLDAAVPLPKTDRGAASLAWAAVGLSAVVASVVAFTFLIAGSSIGVFLNAPALADFWWLLGLTLWFVAIVEVMTTWAVRKAQFPAIASRQIVLGGSTAVVQVGLGIAGVGATGLLAGPLGGRVATFPGFLRRGSFVSMGPPRWRLVRAAISRYRRFPLVASWSALLNSLGLQLPVILVSILYGQASVGLLALAMRVLAAPAIVIGQAMSRVFVADASTAVRNASPKLRFLMLRTTRVLGVFGLAGAVVVFSLGPSLFEWIFGSEWREAGVYARWLAVGYAAQLVVSPVAPLLLILELTTRQLFWDVTRFALIAVVPLLVAQAGGSAREAIMGLSLVHAGMYGLLFLICLGRARHHDRCVTRNSQVNSW